MFPKKRGTLFTVGALIATLGGVTGTATAASASEQGIQILCDTQKVDAYTGKARCTGLGTVKQYRVLVHCVGPVGFFDIKGPWLKSGWSSATCSGNHTSTITGYIETELGR
ncbi:MULTISPECIES: hypothetical protein [unclassified Streptomyces]|uniref:hypothetical protein n=1 Tax=unclassified Streptomyces TaxID=2593676 RepID=UPI003397FF4D